MLFTLFTKLAKSLAPTVAARKNVESTGYLNERWGECGSGGNRWPSGGGSVFFLPIKQQANWRFGGRGREGGAKTMSFTDCGVCREVAS